jgi:hypothetical protein
MDLPSFPTVSDLSNNALGVVKERNKTVGRRDQEVGVMRRLEAWKAYQSDKVPIGTR